MRSSVLALALVGCGSAFNAAADVAGVDAAADVAGDAPTMRPSDATSGDDPSDVNIVEAAADVAGDEHASADVADVGAVVPDGGEADGGDAGADAGDAADACSADPNNAPSWCGCVAAPMPGCASGVGCMWVRNTWAPPACANECGLAPCP